MAFKKYISFLLFLILAGSVRATDIYFSFAGKTVHMADSASAAALVLPPDNYTRELSPFDLAIRLNREGSQESDYLAAAAANVQDWREGEELQLRNIFRHLDSLLQSAGYYFPLPDTLHLISSGTKEEFGAEGYTRNNMILLNTSVLPLSRQLVAHELFHVMSRYHPKWRDAMYAVFHFKPCNNISYKPAFSGKVITNPDCPYLMHYITVPIDGKKQDLSLVLYSGIDYKSGGSINDYARLGLLALEGKAQKKKPVLQKNGQPLVYELDQVPDFFNQVGKNSAYILHIEELCAEHFAALCSGQQLPQPEYLHKMAGLLKRPIRNK